MTTRVAIVTGGASGIGEATVGLLRAQGVAVVVFDRAATEPVDITDVDAIREAVSGVRNDLGPIDILVNAAGVASGGAIEHEHYVESWNRAIAVNLTGMMHMVRACV